MQKTVSTALSPIDIAIKAGHALTRKVEDFWYGIAFTEEPDGLHARFSLSLALDEGSMCLHFDLPNPGPGAKLEETGFSLSIPDTDGYMRDAGEQYAQTYAHVRKALFRRGEGFRLALPEGTREILYGTCKNAISAANKAMAKNIALAGDAKICVQYTNAILWLKEMQEKQR